jgi:hypothetical protein
MIQPKSYHQEDQLETTTSTSGFDLEVIHSYTRKQAIEDGVLIDLADAKLGELSKLAAQLRYQYPIAMTATAFNKYVLPSERAKQMGQCGAGRLWDLLAMLKYRIQQSEPGQHTLLFNFYCQFWEGDETLDLDQDVEPELCTLKCVVGPDDDGSPCLTIMLPDED